MLDSIYSYDLKLPKTKMSNEALYGLILLVVMVLALAGGIALVRFF